MNTFTPGPWSIMRGEIFTPDGECLGVIYRTEAWSTGEHVEHEDQANARLISAAPLLLAALEQQTAVIEMWMASIRGETDVTDMQLANATNASIEVGIAAIVAAKGHTP